MVADCLSGTSLQNSVKCQSPVNCIKKIFPFSVISNTSPHFSSFKFSFKFTLFAIADKKIVRSKKENDKIKMARKPTRFFR